MSDVRHEIVELLPRLMRFAFSLTGSNDEAQDIVQAACERALSRIEQFIPGTRLDSWMFRIVQTVWIDQARVMKNRRALFVVGGNEDKSFDARIHERAEAKELLEIIRAQIVRLPEEQRVVLALVTVDGMSYQDAADLLDIPIGTVMSRLSRARRKLAEAIDAPEAKKHAGERIT